MSRPRLLLPAVLSLALAGCSDYETLARDELTGAGFVKVELSPTGKGSFDFTGAKADGVPCHGTITVTSRLGTTSKVENHTCGVAPAPAETKLAYLEEGAAHEKAGELDKARASYEMGCDKSDAASCNAAALLYLAGSGVTKDAAKGAVLYGKSCDLGNGIGCKNLGLVLRDTDPPQLEVALNAFKKACDLNAPEGCYLVGRAYMDGLGVKADPVLGLVRFERACKAGLQRACGALGLAAALGKGTHADLERGAKLLGEACGKDDAEACLDLGTLVRDGKAPPKDPKRSFALFDKACKLQDPIGCNELGLAYELGQGTAKDRKKANELYRLSCDLGTAVACSNLAIALRDGQGIDKDPKRAAELFDKACAAGMQPACELRKKLH